MTEILSQDEIDALLAAISAGEGASPHGRFRIHDFRRPERLDTDQVRTYTLICESFATGCARAMSAMLRDMTFIKVGSVDQLTLGEFLRSIPNPTALAVFDPSPLPGRALVEIDPSISMTILDRLLGGKGEPSKITRQLSAVDLSLMEGVIVRLLGCLREAWAPVTDLRPRLVNIETNPELLRGDASDIMVCLATLETAVCEIEGMVNLVVPCAALERSNLSLSGDYFPAQETAARSRVPRPELAAHLAFDRVQTWGAGLVSLAELVAMQPEPTLPITDGPGLVQFRTRVTGGDK